MKKTILLSLIILISLFTYGQKKVDYSIAKAGIRISGMYVFIGCEPANDYDYAGDIKVNNFSWTQTTYFEKLVKKAKKKYPNANGMIFRRNNPQKAELITFRGLEKAGGGFRIGDNVKAVLRTKAVVLGKVIQIDDVKRAVRIEYEKDGKNLVNWFAFRNVSIVAE